MALSEREVDHLAGLSKICLEEGEKKQFQLELERIISHAELLMELDVSEVEPCLCVHHELSAPLREDRVTQSIDRECFLLSAPKQIEGLIVVPTVIDKGEKSEG